MLRTGRKGLAAATLLGDMLKGTAAVLIAAMLWGRDRGAASPASAPCSATSFRSGSDFKGGKGVATYIGVLIALFWPVGAGLRRDLGRGRGD